MKHYFTFHTLVMHGFALATLWSVAAVAFNV